MPNTLACLLLIGAAEYTYIVRPVSSFSVAAMNLYWGLQLAGFADLGLAWTEPDRGASAYFGVSLKATRQRQRVR